ncbi:transmembrane protein, putative (macronuclear) [Tetrahymena thermophila SB210]|uniref:Transmembrane protein, putative n=1 Tax=Tetrahymena thermophila (strain SB210) TaxID=312017 RepID=Q22M05_TETTS|nr:transmembrane protein, putative [Tetrahymena thermophila SB210]EAR86365.2 transmembrane protein, putative [Tetrahymena thermophila SB210]|eukprot:XP_977215.2 transmembrane protein, putative [Tetrahymena thermophila SB210]
MLQQVTKFLKQIDIYGQSVQLSFQKKNSFNTVFGGFISFTVLCSFLVGCWFFGKELYFKENPQVIMQERSVNSPKRVDVRPDNLIIMMGISDNNSNFFNDPTIFSVNAVQLTQISVKDPTTGQQTIQLVNNPKTIKQCSMRDVQIPDLVDFFQNLNYTALYCFDSQKNEVYFEGDFNQKQFSQLFVYFQKCQNSTSSQIICKSQEEIDKSLLLTKLSIFISDHIIDPLNFENPVSNKANTLYSSTSSQFPQEASLFLTNYYIDTDAGVFYQQMKEQQTFAFASYEVAPLFGDPNVLMKINIRLQKLKENYMKRQYLKLADVVAQIGGLLKILIIIGALFSDPFQKLQYFKAVIDEIYQFQSSNNNVRLIPKKQQQYSIDQQNEENRVSMKILKKDLKLKKKDQLKLFEYMPKPTINDESIQKDINTLQNDSFSVQTNQQQKHKKFSQTQNISMNNKKQIKKLKQIQQELKHKDESDMAKEAYEGLCNILNKKKISKIDENLVKFIDAEFLQQILCSKQSQQQEENEQSNISQMLNSRSFSIQNMQVSFKKEIDFQNHSTGKNQSKFFKKNSINQFTNQQSYFLDSPKNERQNYTQIQNEILEDTQNLQDLTSSNFINYNDSSYIPNIQTIKKNDNLKFIVPNKENQSR